MMIHKLVPLTFLAVGILAGCDRGKTTEELLIESAQGIVAAQLKDPQSAQFRNMKGSEKARMVCGEINAKNSMGGYIGFKNFMVAGDVDTASHTFQAKAYSLIEPAEPIIGTYSTNTPMTMERAMRALDDMAKQQAYVKALEALANCEKIVPQMKHIEAQELQAKKTRIDKMIDYFKGTEG
jgi:hypothetical protein